MTSFRKQILFFEKIIFPRFEYSQKFDTWHSSQNMNIVVETDNALVKIEFVCWTVVKLSVL